MYKRLIITAMLATPVLVQAGVCKQTVYSKGDVIEIGVSQNKATRVTFPEPVAGVAVAQAGTFLVLWSQNANLDTGEGPKVGAMPPNMVLISTNTQQTDVPDTTINVFGAEGTNYTIYAKRSGKHVLCHDIVDAATRGGVGVGISYPNQKPAFPLGGPSQGSTLAQRDWVKTIHSGYHPIAEPLESVYDDGRYTYVRFRGEQLPVMAELEGRKMVLDGDYDATEHLLTIKAVQPVLFVSVGGKDVRITR